MKKWNQKIRYWKSIRRFKWNSVNLRANDPNHFQSNPINFNQLNIIKSKSFQRDESIQSKIQYSNHSKHFQQYETIHIIKRFKRNSVKIDGGQKNPKIICWNKTNQLFLIPQTTLRNMGTLRRRIHRFRIFLFLFLCGWSASQRQMKIENRSRRNVTERQRLFTLLLSTLDLILAKLGSKLTESEFRSLFWIHSINLSQYFDFNID